MNPPAPARKPFARPAVRGRAAIAPVDAELRRRTVWRALRGISFGWLLAAAALAASGGCARADAARGAGLAERWCAQCHGVLPNQPSAAPKVPSFSEIAAEPSATEPSLRVFLRTPHPSMPNFILQPDDIDDLVDYILSMKPAR